MRRLLPILVVLAPLLLFPGVLAGRVLSADDHLSVHHAYQLGAGGHVRHPLLSDPAVQFAALRHQVVSQIRAGEAPLWNPDLYGGAPLLADGQSMVGSPVTWLHLVLPNPAAQTAGALWILVWAGIGTWLLLRELDLPPPAALAGAFAVQTTPFLSVWLLHPHAATFCWLPGLLWAIERRSIPLVALAGAGLVGGGHPETVAHAGLIALGWMLVRARSWRVLVGGLLGLLLSAPLWLPLVDNALGSATAQAHGWNRMPVAALADLVWPNLRGHPALDAEAPAGWADGVLHPGLAALALALLAIRSRWRWLWLPWAACVGIALIGTPLLNSARLGEIGAVFLALVAAFGVAELPRGRWLAPVLVLATGVWARWHDQGTLAELEEPAPWTEEIAEVVGEGRVIGLGWALQPNTGSLVGLKDLRGYDLPVSERTELLMRALDRRLVRPWFPIESVNAQNRKLLEFAAVRVVLAPEEHHGLDPYDLEAPLHAYLLDPVAPRAWLATGGRRATNWQQALDFVRTGYAGRGNPAVEDLGLGYPAEGEVLSIEWVHDGAGEVVLGLPDGHPRGVVVLADRFDEDWVVEVDGEEAELLRVAGFFRGVEVAAGAAEVRFLYTPWSWRVGLALMGLGLIGVLGSLRAR
ncbi:MAG TPA: hypothetical protein QGF58_30835 [Myxococcota bacterium]|nr:hypothetical protein [Myxococcota bacterium]